MAKIQFAKRSKVGEYQLFWPGANYRQAFEPRTLNTVMAMHADGNAYQFEKVIPFDEADNEIAKAERHARRSK